MSELKSAQTETPLVSQRSVVVRSDYQANLNCRRVDNGFTVNGYDQKGEFNYVFTTKKSLLKFIEKNI